MIQTTAGLEERTGELMVRRHDSRHEATGIALALVDSAVIDGEVVEDVPASQVNLCLRALARASAVVMLLAGLVAGWLYASDSAHADLSAGAFLLSVLAFSVIAGHHTACEQH